MINPINHTRTPEDVERYRREPYVVAGDVYAHPPHMGRGGWTWYTGSAGWLYRAGLEVDPRPDARGATFSIDPCVPRRGQHFRIDWRFGGNTYHIRVDTSGKRTGGSPVATLDGAAVDSHSHSARRRRRVHEVTVRYVTAAARDQVAGERARRHADGQAVAATTNPSCGREPVP